MRVSKEQEEQNERLVEQQNDLLERRDIRMGVKPKVKSVSVTAIDFKNVKPETLMDFLKLFGFSRYVSKYWIVTKKGQDERYPTEQDESPDGLYTCVIVPEYHYDKDLFIIPKEYLEKIVTALKENSL